MSKLRVENFMVSVDGFSAGVNQSLENPFGENAADLAQPFRATKTFHAMIGKTGGTTGVDDQFAIASFNNIGAWIMGRNMFGPQRGNWPDDQWKGWWGPNPPYHTPVYVLTHYPRPTLAMEGGTTFEFVAASPAEVLARAKAAAKGKDVRVGGGVQTVRSFLKAGLVDYLHLSVSPVVMGKGENLLQGIDLLSLGLSCKQTKAGEGALHLVFERQ